jgi:hypothetical protein
MPKMQLILIIIYGINAVDSANSACVRMGRTRRLAEAYLMTFKPYPFPFPERDLAYAFWHFVRGRALDPRFVEEGCTGNVAPTGRLDDLETEREDVYRDLAGLFGNSENLDRPIHYPAEIYPDGPLFPWVFPTIQEALVAFLIDRVVRKAFPVQYEIWLRVVAIILGDAQREPDRWMRVTARIHERDCPEEERETEHVMTVSNDWSCLSHETFDFIVQRYAAESP